MESYVTESIAHQSNREIAECEMMRAPQNSRKRKARADWSGREISGDLAGYYDYTNYYYQQQR